MITFDKSFEDRKKVFFDKLNELVKETGVSIDHFGEFYLSDRHDDECIDSFYKLTHGDHFEYNEVNNEKE